MCVRVRLQLRIYRRIYEVARSKKQKKKKQLKCINLFGFLQ